MNQQTTGIEVEMPQAWNTLLNVMSDGWIAGMAPVEAENIADILSALSAPPDLRGVCEVAANVVEMKPVLSTLASDDSLKKVNLCIHVCEQIVERKERIVAQLPLAMMHARKKKRLIKTYTEHPLYGCLWHRAALTDYQQQFLLLQGYLLNYFIRFGHDAVTSHPYIWAKSVRILSEPWAMQEAILKHLPATALMPVLYREQLIAAQSVLSGDRAAVVHLGDLTRMLDVLVTGIAPLGYERDGVGVGSTGGKPVRGGMPEDFVELGTYEVDLPGGGMTRITQWQPLFEKPGRRASSTRKGVSPEDEIPPFSEISVGDNRFDSGCYTVRDYILRTKDARRAMARGNLVLPGRWESMNHHDLSELARGLRDG